jgi:hypothetical protein
MDAVHSRQEEIQRRLGDREGSGPVLSHWMRKSKNERRSGD